MKKGFTLVELVIVIVIVGILSIVAVPIYRGYVEKAKRTEGKALASAIRTAQTIYFAEHGEYYNRSAIVDYDPVLQIDARGNKYYKTLGRTGASATTGISEATVIDSTNPGDTLTLYWNTDLSAPVSLKGDKLPVFHMFVDGKYYYNI